MKTTYSPASGLIFKNGVPVGTKHSSGYVVVRHSGKVVYAHRLAWFLTYGVWPGVLDHINGDRADNRIANLREVSPAGNAQNMRLNGALPGAHFHKPTGLWKSSICVNRKQKHLGYFPSAELASEAYLLAKELVHSTWRGHHA